MRARVCVCIDRPLFSCAAREWRRRRCLLWTAPRPDNRSLSLSSLWGRTLPTPASFFLGQGVKKLRLKRGHLQLDPHRRTPSDTNTLGPDPRPHSDSVSFHTAHREMFLKFALVGFSGKRRKNTGRAHYKVLGSEWSSANWGHRSIELIMSLVLNWIYIFSGEKDINPKAETLGSTTKEWILPDFDNIADEDLWWEDTWYYLLMPLYLSTVVQMWGETLFPENKSFKIVSFKKQKNNKNKTKTNQRHIGIAFQNCVTDWISVLQLWKSVSPTSNSVCRCWSWKTLWRKSRSFSLQSVKAWISSKLSNTWDTAPVEHTQTHTPFFFFSTDNGKL